MSDSRRGGEILEFGAFRLDLRKQLLYRGGATIPATPKVYDLLVALVKRRGSLATKDDLMAEVWPDAIVDDGSLARTVSRLRALLDDGQGPELVETLPRRGYRFSGEVRVVNAEEKPKSIAVLPFTFLGPPPATFEYAGLGIADALITRLSRLTALEVRPTSSVVRFAGADAIAAARELRVDSVIDGRLQIHGERMRATVQLITVAAETPAWAEVFDENTSDMLALQDSLSERVWSALTVEISRDEAKELKRRPTSSPEAWQHFLRGRAALFTYAPTAIEKALRSFAVAVEIDPSFAAAHAATAFTYLISAGALFHPAQVIGKAKSAAARALEIDESLADAHIAMGALRIWLDLDPDGAEQELLRALQLAPNDPFAHHTYAWQLISRGRFSAASAEMERAVELDPTSLPAICDRGLPYYFGGDPQRALELFEQASRIDPTFWYAHRWAGLALLSLGRNEEARRAFEEAVALSRGFAPEASINLASALLLLHRESEADSILSDASKAGVYASPYEMAALRLASGDREEALDLLEQAVDEPDKWVRWIGVDPRFDPLRSEPRFAAIRRRTRL